MKTISNTTTTANVATTMPLPRRLRCDDDVALRADSVVRLLPPPSMISLLMLMTGAVLLAPMTAASTLDLYRNARLGARIVPTRYGRLQGLELPLDHYKFLRPIEAFLGVPYATPPTGTNRFSPTRAALPWDGIRTADKFSPVCPQRLPSIQNETAALERMPKGRLEYLKRLLPFLQNQSEDCLYLNVFAPMHATASGSEKKLPVIVFLHGESFEWNGGSPYDGTVLASYGEVVVVTLNYRLGILGFLNANPVPHLRARVANYGLMDQIAALHWVKQNIAKFGGDSDMVTLAGHGSGAACINFLMTSPTMVPNLFHRAILLSGSAFSSWALVEEPVVYALKLARDMNCTVPEDLIRNHEQIVDCMRAAPLEDLMGADIQAPTFLSAFGPSVDGVVIRTGLSNQEEDEHSNGGGGRGQSKRSQDASGRYDLLFGVVTSEALWRFSAADIQNGFEGERRDKILRTYVRNAYTYHLSEIFYTVVNEYTDWERTSQHPINTRDAAVAALSDAQFVAPLVHTGDLLAPLPALPGQQKTGPKCYFYVFDYQTKDGDYPQRMGSVHGEDLPYVFGAPLVDGFSHFPRNYTKSEVALSEALMVFWTNFARTGNPNEHHRQDPVLVASKERNRFRSMAWEEYDPVHQKFLEIGMKPRMKNHFRAHQLSIWLRLIPELHRAGMEDVIARHNMFKNHDDADLYEGAVKPDLMSRMTFLDGSGTQRRGNASEYGVTTADPSPLSTCLPGNYTIGGGHNNAAVYGGSSSNAPAAGRSGSGATSHHNATGGGSGSGGGGDTLSGFEPAGYAAYSTALSVTIAIGCSLLILNVMIFAGVYYQRDKTRLEVKTLQKQYQQQRGIMHHHQHHGGGGGGSGSGGGGYDPIKHAHYHPGMGAHSPGHGNVMVDMEGGGGGNHPDINGTAGAMLAAAVQDTKGPPPPHICANAMQNCMQQQQQQQQQMTKVPLGEGVRGDGGGGQYGVKQQQQQQQHREHNLMGSTATPLKQSTHGTLARNNSMYNTGMMTLPKKVGGAGGGGVGVMGGVPVMVQQNTYTRNDCMTLPRNMNAATRATLNGNAEALPNNQPDTRHCLHNHDDDDVIPTNIPPRPTPSAQQQHPQPPNSSTTSSRVHSMHAHNQQQHGQQHACTVNQNT